VGDPGRNIPNGPQHNVNDLFNLAAQTKANELSAQGNKVIGCRISSVEDFNTQITQNGFISGDVYYFGHSGGFLFSSGRIASELFIGSGTGADTNINFSNVNKLCNPPGCTIGNYLSQNTAIRIFGCYAGTAIDDALAGYTRSIAQIIANQLKRGVYAYDVGMYFSRQTANQDSNFSGKLVTTKFSDTLPIYMVPEGTPGSKPSPVPFMAH
jgi:hypothetical protein